MDFEQIIIRSPLPKNEYNAYYLLRWQVLRAPWKQDKGSEKDELEDNSVHRIAVLNNKIIACGRLHFIDQLTAQIRYMAVSEEFLHKGIGSRILVSLEDAARENNIKTIVIDAREAAVSFYEKHGYQLLEKSHLLFNEIQHYKMLKNI